MLIFPDHNGTDSIFNHLEADVADKNATFRQDVFRLMILCLILMQISSIALAWPSYDTETQASGYYYPFPNSGYGVGFLTIQSGARARAMGEVSAALTDNPTGFMHNPASLVHARRIAASGSYSEWLSGILPDWDMFSFSASATTENYGSAGLSIQILRMGTIRYTDETGFPLGESKPYQMIFTGGYAYPLGPNFAAGANLKVYTVDYGDMGAGVEAGDNSPSTIAFDIGVMVFDLLPHLTMVNENLSFVDHPSGFARFARDFGMPRLRGISLGICVRNIGPDLKYSDFHEGDPLPHTFSLGFAYRAIDTDPFGLLIAGDMNSLLLSEIAPLSDGTIYKCGMELSLYRLIDLRGGCVHSIIDGSRYLTLGFGVGTDKFKFNYSYIPEGQEARVLNENSFFELSVHF